MNKSSSDGGKSAAVGKAKKLLCFGQPDRTYSKSSSAIQFFLLKTFGKILSKSRKRLLKTYFRTSFGT